MAATRQSTRQSDTSVNDFGYRSFALGGFKFERDEYFARITWPEGSHSMPVDLFLRAMIRDLAWSFFYGTVNFDNVFGTTNHYGNVDVFAGLYNSGYRKQNREHVENFKSDDVKAMFEALLEDWTNEGFDPFAAPQETGSMYSSVVAQMRLSLTAAQTDGFQVTSERET